MCSSDLGQLQKEVGPVQKVSLVNNEFAIYVNDKRFTLEQIMEIGTKGTQDNATETNQAVKKNYLLSLLNQNVVVNKKTTVKDEDGKEEEKVEKIEGLVERVSSDNNEYRVYVGGEWYSLDDVVEVGAAVQEA